MYSDNPTQTKEDRPYAGYGFGMSALDLSAYDPLQRYFYAVSGVGFINILDWQDPKNPVVSNFAMDMTDLEGVEDIKVCMMLFVGDNVLLLSSAAAAAGVTFCL